MHACKSNINAISFVRSIMRNQWILWYIIISPLLRTYVLYAKPSIWHSAPRAFRISDGEIGYGWFLYMIIAEMLYLGLIFGTGRRTSMTHELRDYMCLPKFWYYIWIAALGLDGVVAFFFTLVYIDTTPSHWLFAMIPFIVHLFGIAYTHANNEQTL